MNTVVDNTGIYILETKNQFRVAYSAQIEKIYGAFDDELGKWKPNNDELIKTFGESPIFPTENAAMNYALDLTKVLGETEFGICILKTFKGITFPVVGVPPKTA